MIVLVRLDERLIHGQVVIGWRNAARPSWYHVIDDEIAESDWEAELVLAGVPDGTQGEVCTISQAVGKWSEWVADTQRHMVLVQSPATLCALHDAGVGLDDVNAGGMHGRVDRTEITPYIHLDEDELNDCRRLCEAGIVLEARDLPTTAGVDLCPLLATKGR